ncbi:MAG: MaoC family dehydratase [Acidimicrobiales bacterium]
MPRPATRVVSYSQLPSLAGEHLGESDWLPVTQDHIDTFAQLTGDEQWVHVDPERAASSSFGTTIGHGFFTLSLATRVIYELIEVTGAGLILNYGLNRVRFPAPVPSGSRIRAALEIPSVEEVAGGLQVTYRLTYEVEGGSKPPCVADVLFRYYESERPEMSLPTRQEVRGS